MGADEQQTPMNVMDALSGIASALEVLKSIGEAGTGLRTSLQSAGWPEETAEGIAVGATTALMLRVIEK